jgi:hypothetical protein
MKTKMMQTRQCLAVDATKSSILESGGADQNLRQIGHRFDEADGLSVRASDSLLDFPPMFFLWMLINIDFQRRLKRCLQII